MAQGGQREPAMTDATDDAEFVQQWIACEIEQHGQWIHDDRTS